MKSLPLEADMSSSMAAPSLSPEALPAVTVPPVLANAGLSAASDVALASPLMYSSVCMVVGAAPRLFGGIGTGTICSANRPACVYPRPRRRALLRRVCLPRVIHVKHRQF